MARFDVYANPFAGERRHTPYVLDVQNDHLAPIGSRVVIPLRTASGFGAAARDLNPTLDVEGRRLVLDTASIASVNGTLLKRPVAHVAQQRSDVINALDTLFGSY
ncbi:CcdB family protein [Methylibium sp.]|uniref:CcdB family protein n=1 Tax=Methylibium sp. TaxID=2067992 RepID=UPI0017F56BD4|nr:CcdB family protein [Methylibium sp.]MBA3591166.1 CcdB family protein [Methylibium sp.]